MDSFLVKLSLLKRKSCCFCFFFELFGGEGGWVIGEKETGSEGEHGVVIHFVF